MVSHIFRVLIKSRIAQHFSHNCAMFQFNMRLHIVASRKRLPTQRAQIRLWPMDCSVMPTIAYSFTAYTTRVQCGRFGYTIEEVAVVLRRGRVTVVVVKGGVSGAVVGVERGV